MKFLSKPRKRVKVKVYLVVLLCATHLGCASYTRFHESPALNYETLNGKLSGRVVEITLVDDQVFTGTEVKIAEDSTSWRESRTHSLVQMRTDSIYRFTIYKHRTGDGLLLGLISGFAAGAVIGYAGGEDCEPDEEDCISRGTSAAILGTLLAVPGLLVGTLVGATTEKPNHYIMNQREEN